MSSTKLLILAALLSSLMVASCMDVNAADTASTGPITPSFSGPAAGLGDAEKIPLTERLQCVTDTCGSPDAIPTVSEPLDKTSVGYVETTIKPQLTTWMSSESQLLNTENKAYQKLLTTPITSISDDYRVLMNYVDVLAGLHYAIPAIKISGMDISIDLQGVINNMTDIADPAEKLWLAQSLKLVLESEAFSDKLFFSHLSLDAFIRLLYKDGDVMTNLKNDAQTVRLALQHYTSVYKNFRPLTIVEKNILDKIDAGQFLNASEKDAYMSLRFHTELNEQILPGGSFRSQLLARSLSANDQKKEVLKNTTIPAFAAIANSPTASATQTQTNTFLCEGVLASLIVSSPTPEQNAAFLEKMNHLKSVGTNLIHTLNLNDPTIDAGFNSAVFLMPATQAEVENVLDESINDGIQTIANSTSHFSQANLQNPDDQQLALLMLSLNRSSTQNIYQDVEDFCVQNTPKEIIDKSYPTLAVVDVGWRSVIEPQYGFGIMSHEMGHVFSHLADHKVDTIRSCLDTLKNSDQYEEEDFADLFAAKLTSADPLNMASKSFSCLLVNQDKTGNYTNLSYQAADGDIHSSGFYRLLEVGYIQNDLTPSCKSVVAANPKLFTDCWKN